MNPNKKVEILFMARVVKSKGIFEAIQAVKLAKKNFSGIRFNIAGDGPDLKDAKELVSQSGMESYVRFLGHVKGAEKINALKSADLFLLPSYTEGMPISLLEAMAFGLPVITCPVGGLKDFFIDGKNGFLIQSRKPEDISTSIANLLNDAKLFNDIANYNYRYAKENFLASQVAKRLENLYANTLNSEFVSL